MRAYDEAAEIESYVWRWQEPTEFETRCMRAGLLRLKFPKEQECAERSELMAERALDDPEIDAALTEGYDALCARLRARLVREHGRSVMRCSRCGRVLASPLAKQCRWCGLDWHRP